MKLKTKLDGHT